MEKGGEEKEGKEGLQFHNTFSPFSSSSTPSSLSSLPSKGGREVGKGREGGRGVRKEGPHLAL